MLMVGSEEDEGISIYMGTCWKMLIREMCTNSVWSMQSFPQWGVRHPIPTAMGLLAGD